MARIQFTARWYTMPQKRWHFATLFEKLSSDRDVERQEEGIAAKCVQLQNW